MTGDLQVNRASVATPTLGYLILGSGTGNYLGYDGAKHVLSTPRFDILNDAYVYRVGAPTTGFVILGNSATNYVGFDGTNVVANGSQIRTVANDTRIGVPLGAVVWFRTAAEVTAAGASWAVETNLAGRFPIGAGTTFSQTFVEATNYGANWTPLTGATIAASGETPFLASPTGGTTNVNTSSHTHLVPTTTWLIPSRAGVFARRV